MNFVEFLAKYWLEFAFGLVATGISSGAGFVWKKLKSQNQKKWVEMQETLSKELSKQLKESHESLLQVIQDEETSFKAADQKIHSTIDIIETNLDKLAEGVLSIQGHQFKETCRKLLEHDHTITLAEFEQICNEHRIYNSLGGNHEGDNLFKLVETKYQAGLHHIV